MIRRLQSLAVEGRLSLLHDHQDGFLRDALPDEELAVLELTHPAFWSVTTTLVFGAHHWF